jgi:very-short-patch-repair endonuclease
MEELLLNIGEMFHSELLIANAGVIVMAITYIGKCILDMVRNRKTVKVEVDNKETNEKLERLSKENEELRRDNRKIKNLLMLMIRHSRLSDEAKVKAEDIDDGKEVDTTAVAEDFTNDDNATTVVEKLSQELNK